MKRFKETMKMVVALMSLCLVFVLSITADAAKYQPNVTYVDPQINSKDQYYSTTRMRMTTYSDRTVRIIYPKDAKVTLKTNKKALSAMVTYQCNELDPYPTGKKVYVTPTSQDIYDYNMYRRLYVDATGRLYYTSGGENVYPTTIRVYVKMPGENYYSSRTLYYDAATKTWYYEKWDDNKDEYVKQTVASTYWEWDYYYKDAEGYSHSVYKDNVGYYYRDYDVTVYENSQTVTYDDGKTPDYQYAVADIQLTSTKKGNYKLYITVNGKKTTVNVYVYPYGSRTYTSVKLGKNTINSVSLKETAKNYTYTEVSNYQVSSKTKSGKLSLKANKGIKITGIVTAYTDKNGNPCFKKTKNNKKINLSQAYAYQYRDASYGESFKDATKETFVFISYNDTYLKTSYTYSVVTKHGVKQVKEVYKAPNGKKYTRYYDFGDYGSSMIRLWSY